MRSARRLVQRPARRVASIRVADPPALRPASLLVSLLLASAAGCDLLGLDGGDPGAPKEGDTTVLFIGSSYLAFYDVPRRFEGFAREAGEKVWTQAEVLPGHYLDYFASNARTTLRLRERDWDYVVLQDAGHNVAYPASHGAVAAVLGHHPLRPALGELKRKATELSPGTKVVFMLPWAFEDGITWIQGETDDYRAMQIKIRETGVAWARDLGLVVAPVGMAFHQVMTTWDAPVHFLFEEDWNHANANGAYLTAATLFSTVFARSVAEVPYDWTLDRGLAGRLRQVASAVVMDSLALWNIRK